MLYYLKVLFRIRFCALRDFFSTAFDYTNLSFSVTILLCTYLYFRKVVWHANMSTYPVQTEPRISAFYITTKDKKFENIAKNKSFSLLATIIFRFMWRFRFRIRGNNTWLLQFDQYMYAFYIYCSAIHWPFHLIVQIFCEISKV